jgi:predicted CXXCH cytochrome family protein
MKKILVATLIVAALCLAMVTVVAAQAPDDAELSGEQCKMCHAEEYEVWAATAHPNSINAVKESDHGSEDCLHCMSADYRWDETLTVETAQYGVTCLACHDPHETAGDAMPAIDDVAALCKDCHNAHVEEGMAAEPGTTMRHAVKEMMEAYGAVDAEGTVSPHDASCTLCHADGGHEFIPTQASCDGCHGGAAVIEESGKAVRDFIAANIETEGLSDKWPAAYTNLTMLNSDDSGGIHNPAYAAAIVAATEAQLAAEPLEVVEEEPAEEPAVEPEPELPETGGVPVAGPALLLLSGTLALAGGLGSYVWTRRK